MRRSLLLPFACFAFLAAPAGAALAQEPAPAPGYGQPQPGYGQTQPAPGYGQPPPGYGQTPPGYAPAPPGYGYGPPGYYPPAIPPPPPRPPASCCRWSVRFDPFDLIFQRLTFEGELALAGPFTLEIAPTYIFGYPDDNMTASGFALAANLGFYFDQPMHGFWIKAHAGYENFTATLTNPGLQSSTASAHASSAILGALLGSTLVFGRNGGFAFSGGIGLGVKTAPTITLTAPGDGVTVGPYTDTIYDKLDRLALLGTLGLGVAF
jgi:hypothetical protein